MKQRVLLLYNSVNETDSLDAKDVLQQVRSVKLALQELDYYSQEYAVKNSKDLCELSLDDWDIVFNLVESLNNKSSIASVLPDLIISKGKQCTGNSSKALYITGDKLLSHKICKGGGLNVPDCIDTKIKEPIEFFKDKTFIVKPVNEDASIGIHQDSVIKNSSYKQLSQLIEKKQEDCNCLFFAEEYIDGREWNISLFGDKEPIILPPAEIVFKNYENRNKILDYNSKWDEHSFEYKNTLRKQEFDKQDQSIIQELSEISLKCWNIFELNGYARIDFRTDKNNLPYIIDINANPCISPDSGFVAALDKSKILYKEFINKIIKSTLR